MCAYTTTSSNTSNNTSFDFEGLDNEDSGEKGEKKRAFIVDGYAWKSFEGRFKVMVKGKV